jgi:TPR repeat protein
VDTERILGKIASDQEGGMGRTTGAAIGALLLASIAAGAAAADRESATAAYDRGDYRAAFEEYQALANSGDSQGMLWLGYLYQEGQGTARDYGESMRYFQMAADMGEAVAFYYVGNIHYFGYGVAKDPVEAVRWYRQAAERGDSWGQFALGYAHERGDGAPRDLPAARRWYQAAADQGYAEAQEAIQRLTANPE